MKKARALRNGAQYDEAIAAYHEALRKKPSLIRAHLELGVMYEEQKENYILAIYHYNYYLDARPETKKKQLLKDSVRHAEQKFAARFPLQPEIEETIAVLEMENKNLKRDNMLLKHQVAELNVELSNRPASIVVAEGQVLSGSTGPSTGVRQPQVLVMEDHVLNRPGVTTGSSRSRSNTPSRYTVKQGDTLMGIAKREYGDPRGWVKILEANKRILPRAEKLSVGMELVIPR